MQLTLQGRTALITGGSRGLGLAMAERFASSGASVAIIGRDRAVLDAAAETVRAAGGGGAVVAHSCDVRDAAALSATHSAVVEALGPVDVLVNNAGTSAAGPFLEVSDEDWQNDLDLKLMAAIRLARLCIPDMQQQRWGRIINVLNIGAKAPGARTTPTTVSRAAGMALTKALAAEMAPFGILVNALNTGLLLTHQWERLHRERAPEVDFGEFMGRMADRIPVGRVGDPAEFANLACFLASDAASYVTGTAINVDGGLSPVW